MASLLAVSACFGQADVIELSSCSTIDGRALVTHILQQNAALVEECVQAAWTARIQAFGNYGDVIDTPFSGLVQLAGMPPRKIEPDGHADLTVRLAADPDRIVSGRRLSVDSKNALGW